MPEHWKGRVSSLALSPGLCQGNHWVAEVKVGAVGVEAKTVFGQGIRVILLDNIGCKITGSYWVIFAVLVSLYV